MAFCLTKGCELSDLSLEELKVVDPIFEEDVYDFIGVNNAVSKFCSYGSTGSSCVSEQLDYWVSRLNGNGGAIQ